MQGFGHACIHGRVGPCVECFATEQERRARSADHRIDPATGRCLNCRASSRAIVDGHAPVCGIEIITDPSDRRGEAARRVGQAV